MSMIAAIFLRPIEWESGQLPMLLPLCLAVAIVYKTIKLNDLRRLPVAVVLLWFTMILSMIAITIAIYIIIWLFS